MLKQNSLQLQNICAPRSWPLLRSTWKNALPHKARCTKATEYWKWLRGTTLKSAMARLCKGRSYLAALATSLQQTTGKPNRSTTALLLDATCIHPRSMNHVSFSAGRLHLPLGVHRPKTSAPRGCYPPSPSRRSRGHFCLNDFAPKHTSFKASTYLSKMFCMSSSKSFRLSGIVPVPNSFASKPS